MCCEICYYTVSKLPKCYRNYSRMMEVFTIMKVLLLFINSQGVFMRLCPTTVQLTTYNSTTNAITCQTVLVYHFSTNKENLEGDRTPKCVHPSRRGTDGWRASLLLTSEFTVTAKPSSSYSSGHRCFIFFPLGKSGLRNLCCRLQMFPKMQLPITLNDFLSGYRQAVSTPQGLYIDGDQAFFLPVSWPPQAPQHSTIHFTRP